jgi:hypothetical protein
MSMSRGWDDDVDQTLMDERHVARPESGLEDAVPTKRHTADAIALV